MTRFLQVALLLVIYAVYESTAIRCYACGPGTEDLFKNTNHIPDTSTIKSTHSEEDGDGVSDKSSNSDESINTTVKPVETQTAHEETVPDNNSNTATSDSANDGEDTPMLTSSCENFDVKNSSFIVDCPDDFMGCITQNDGTQVTRGCETLAIDDCKAANGITYCYCSTDLCNDQHIDDSSEETHSHSLGPTSSTEPGSDDEDLSESSGSVAKQFEFVKKVIVYDSSADPTYPTRLTWTILTLTVFRFWVN